MADEHGLDELALRGAAAALPPLERWAQELFPRVTVLRGCCSPRPAALEGALRLADLWS